MRLTVLCLGHGKTKKDRFGFGDSGPTGSSAHGRHSGIAHGPSDSFAGSRPNDTEGCRQGDWGWASDGGSSSRPVPALEARHSSTAPPMGRATTGTHEIGRRRELFGGMEAQGRTGRVSSGDGAARCFRTKSGPQAQAVGSLSPAGATPLAKSGSGHSTPQGPAGSAGGVEKKTLPEELAALLKADVVRERPIRLMFQDEARFGRMARIRRCWAPAPLRPVVRNGYEREFTYVYGGVSPLQGQLDWSLSEKMNTSHMSAFLNQVSQAHPQEFIIMVLDGASSHKAKELVLPENIRLIRLPAYAPELNPQEHIWDEVREKAFPNLVLDQMTLVVERLKDGMGILAADADRVRRITAWPWIISLILKAN